ncbi:lysophosphatidic acid receptor 6-like isoform X3 [Arapaima gigas]
MKQSNGFPMVHCPQMEQNYSCGNRTGENVFQKAAYIPVFTVGLFFNVLAIYIFLRGRSGWTDTHVYTFSLALANSVLLLFLPIRTYDSFHRLDCTPFCKLLISIHYLNMYVSIFTRAAISIHRCVAVNFPIYKRSRGPQKRVAFVVCVLIWVGAIGLNVAFHEDYSVEKFISCYERKWERLPAGHLELLLVVGFFIPLCVITVCTIQTIVSLHKSGKVSKKTGMTGIMTVNLVVFVICYSPIHVGFLLKFYIGKCTCPTYLFYQVSEWMATTNCCWDPVGYYFLLKKFFTSKCHLHGQS